jgi:hypothetical protein
VTAVDIIAAADSCCTKEIPEGIHRNLIVWLTAIGTIGSFAEYMQDRLLPSIAARDQFENYSAPLPA